MALTFEIGDPSAPKGHAIAYFRSGADVLATYVLVLPISMDMGKYLPPLLASQLGGMAGNLMGEGMGSFAAPPVPEQVESLDYLERLARVRGDDLVSGGTVVLGDVAAAMSEAAEVVQEYARLYDAHTKLATAASAGGPQATDAQPTALDAGADQGGGRVDHVLYELMTERDKLGELSKLVGTMRFATERDDGSLVAETDESIEALERLLPERYWTAKVRAAAKDTSENGAKLAQLYVERCYKLLDDDFAAVQLLEKRIGDFL